MEIEIKLRVRNAEFMRQQVLSLGCLESVPRSLEENSIWDFPDQPLKQRGQLIRLRRFADRCFLTFKGVPRNSKQFKIRPELETSVQDGVAFAAILKKLGLRVEFRYEKFRTTFLLRSQGRHLTVALDETPIGNYLEIEGSKAGIRRFAADLGYQPSDFITDSYGALFESSALARRQRDMVFPRKKRPVKARRKTVHGAKLT